MGFATSKSDSSLFIRQDLHGLVNILLYVDDLGIFGADPEEIDCVKSELAASFDMKDLGDRHYFLRIEVIRTPEGILISRRHCALSMLFKFKMMEPKSVVAPLYRTIKLHPKTRGACELKSFRQIVSNLTYLNITRPNLIYLVGLISQFMSQPTIEHLQ
mgnify:FL=1